MLSADKGNGAETAENKAIWRFVFLLFSQDLTQYAITGNVFGIVAKVDEKGYK